MNPTPAAIEEAARRIRAARNKWITPSNEGTDYDLLLAQKALSGPLGDMVLVPRAALDWLNGEAPDGDGKWFGDCVEAKKLFRGNPRPYWWRTKFRAMIAAAGEK